MKNTGLFVSLSLVPGRVSKDDEDDFDKRREREKNMAALRWIWGRWTNPPPQTVDRITVYPRCFCSFRRGDGLGREGKQEADIMRQPGSLLFQ